MKQSSFQFCLTCLLAPQGEAGPVKFSPRVQRKNFWNKKGRAGELPLFVQRTLVQSKHIHQVASTGTYRHGTDRHKPTQLNTLKKKKRGALR